MRAGRRAALFVGLVAAGVATENTSGTTCVDGLEQQHLGRLTDAESGASIPGGIVTWTRASGEAQWSSQARTQARTPMVVASANGWFAPESAWGPGGTVRASALGYRERVLPWEEATALEWRIALLRDPLALDEVVVTADGRPRHRSEVALQIESVGREEIRAAGSASADRLLAELPGLQVGAGTPTGSNLSIRGIGGARVLVLLDGQPAGGALIENRDLSRMSLGGVDRIEVVKGPLSSLYGSDALGGVVNVVTRAPSPGFRIDAQATSGGAGRREAHATVSGGGRPSPGGAFGYQVNGSWRQEDRVAGVADRDVAFARVWDLRSSVRFRTDRWAVRGDASLLRERQRWPVGGGFSGFNDNMGASGWIEARRRAGRGEWTGRVFAHDYDHLYRSARGSAPVAGSGAPEQQERLGRATLAYSAAWGAHHFDVGVEGALRGIRSPEKLLEDRASDRQIDLYVQDAWRLGWADPRGGPDGGPDGSPGEAVMPPGATVLTVGTRITRNSRWGSTASPSMGVSVAVGEGVRLRGAVARGFRAPSFKELAWNFVNLGGGYILQGFADLEPERSWNVSAGVEWQPASGVLTGVEVFANQVENLIESGFVGHAPSGLSIYSPRNVAEAVTRGFELDFRAVTAGGRGEVVAGYAYLDARSLRPDLPLDRQAKHSTRVRTSWTVGRLRFDATGHLTGQAPIIGPDADGRIGRVGTQGRFAALDLRAAMEVGRGFGLLAGVDNVFDSRPEGWQGFVERRFRLTGEVRRLFDRSR